MANFNIQFLDSDDDLSMLMQRDNENVNNIFIDDMEELLDSSRDSAVCSLVSVQVGDSNCDSDSEIINVAERYKPITEDISEDDE